MYGLSATEDLSFFVGVDLLQVCVGKNEVILNFDRGVRVTVLSDLAVTNASGRSDRYDDPIEAAKALLDLLHDSVKNAQATGEGGLRIDFASGRAVEVFDTSLQYESFSISAGKKEIVV